MIELQRIYKVFGDAPERALRLLELGENREAVRRQTGAFVAVEDVSLGIERGRILVLMGRSGSGKSTVLRCMNGLVRPDRGQVWIDDGGTRLDLAAATASAIRRVRQGRVSMVFQNGALLPWRTVAQNVALGLEIRGVPSDEIARAVDEKLALVGLSEWRDRPIATLSGGMQQRVNLARALATQPDLLLLDEPFSALDPLLRARMQDELIALQRKLGKTLVFVTHDLEEALKLGDRIAIFEEGRAVQVGTPVEIFTQPRTDYVRAFVANVNPASVLSGAAVMRPTDRLHRDPGAADVLLLDERGEYRCRVDPAGAPTMVWYRGDPAPLVRLPAFEEALARGDLAPGSVVSAPTDLRLRDLLRVQRGTGGPVAILDERGALVGIVGGRELIDAMARGPAGT